MIKTLLIDKYLPDYSFNEYHEILINSSVENIYNSAKNFDLSKSKLIKFLFKLRGLPTKRLKLQDFITDIGFTSLEENFPIENLIGFWVKNKILPIKNHEDFINNTISPRVKVVWNFYLKGVGTEQTILRASEKKI